MALSEDMQQQTEWGEDGTSPDPTGALVHYVVTFLASAFLAGGCTSVRMARSAAFETLVSYRATNLADLITIAQVIAFSAAALRTVSLSLVEDVPVEVILRLNDSANALSRTEHRARALLRQGQQAGARRGRAAAADRMPDQDRPREADAVAEPAVAAVSPLDPQAPAAPTAAEPVAGPRDAAAAPSRAKPAQRQGTRVSEAVLQAMEAISQAAGPLPADGQSQKLRARALASAAIGAMTGAYDDWPSDILGPVPPAAMPPEPPRR